MDSLNLFRLYLDSELVMGVFYMYYELNQLSCHLPFPLRLRCHWAWCFDIKQQHSSSHVCGLKLLHRLPSHNHLSHQFWLHMRKYTDISQKRMWKCLCVCYSDKQISVCGSGGAGHSNYQSDLKRVGCRSVKYVLNEENSIHVRVCVRVLGT